MLTQVGGEGREPLHAVRMYLPVVAVLGVLVSVLLTILGLALLSSSFHARLPTLRPLFDEERPSAESTAPHAMSIGVASESRSAGVPGGAPWDGPQDARHDDQRGGSWRSRSPLSIPSVRAISSECSKPAGRATATGDSAMTASRWCSVHARRPLEPARRGGRDRDARKTAITAGLCSLRYAREGLGADRRMMEVRFTIDGDGSVRRVSGTRDTLRTPELANRIKQIVETWRFPAPLAGAPVQVIYPFTFRRAVPK